MGQIKLLHKPLRGKANPGSFRGPLNCPFCNHLGFKISKWKYVEHITPFRIRYRCKECSRTVQYDFANNPSQVQQYPYSPFKKNKFRNIVERWKLAKRIH